jgi:hypothetical protein
VAKNTYGFVPGTIGQWTVGLQQRKLSAGISRLFAMEIEIS